MREKKPRSHLGNTLGCAIVCGGLGAIAGFMLYTTVTLSTVIGEGNLFGSFYRFIAHPASLGLLSAVLGGFLYAVFGARPHDKDSSQKGSD